jgi:hypothetical protein
MNSRLPLSSLSASSFLMGRDAFCKRVARDELFEAAAGSADADRHLTFVFSLPNSSATASLMGNTVDDPSPYLAGQLEVEPPVDRRIVPRPPAPAAPPCVFDPPHPAIAITHSRPKRPRRRFSIYVSLLLHSPCVIRCLL